MIPKIKLNLTLNDKGAPFLTIRRYSCHIEYPDGSIVGPFNHDVLWRKNIDAAVILAYNDGGIYLRSCVRPSLYERDEYNLWELPAGLIEAGENPIECACRETEEELGFKLKVEDYEELGNYTFPSVGTIGERIYFYSVKVRDEDRFEPKLDGSPLEAHGVVKKFTIDTVIRMIEEGQLRDAKTELGIWRFRSIKK